MRHYDPETFRRFLIQIRESDWEKNQIDNIPTLEVTHGGFGLTIYTYTKPVRWSVVLLSMDNLVGGGHFVEEGTAETIEEAKAAMLEGREAVGRFKRLLNRAIGYLVGEVKLGTGASWDGRPSDDPAPLEPPPLQLHDAVFVTLGTYEGHVGYYRGKLDGGAGVLLVARDGSTFVRGIDPLHLRRIG